jgi:DNA-binding IclR family transcriptional regulator
VREQVQKAIARRVTTTRLNNSTLGVLSVLQHFSRIENAQSVTEIADALRMTRNMAFRAVSFLETRNYVARESSSRKFHLSYGILDLCHDHALGFDIRSLCMEYIARIHELTQETVSLTIPVGKTCIVADGIEPRVQSKFGRLRYGFALPLHGGAGPRAIISCFSNDEIERYLREIGPLKQKTGRVMSIKRFWTEIRKIRENGYALSIPEYVDDNTRHVAFAVKDVAGRPHGAITVTGSAGEFTASRTEQLLPQLQSLFEELNKQSQLIPSSAIANLA